MQTEIRCDNPESDPSLQTWTLYVNSKPSVERESFSVADRVKWYLDCPERWDVTEACDVASVIRRAHAEESA